LSLQYYLWVKVTPCQKIQVIKSQKYFKLVDEANPIGNNYDSFVPFLEINRQAKKRVKWKTRKTRKKIQRKRIPQQTSEKQ